jgi:Trypsin-like peptidase domain
VPRQDLFAACRSGVAQICLERGRDRLTAGSAFLVAGGLVTNSHVFRDIDFDVAVLRFDDIDYANGVRLTREVCIAAIEYESPLDEHDVAFLRLNEPEFKNRHTFQFGDSAQLRVGDETGFLGYPFQMPNLTCHIGTVSSLHRNGQVDIIQVDGSVNGGNSGGPLIELTNGHVVGIITRAEIGFLADQFDQLIAALRRNVELLQQNPGVRAVLGGVDAREGFRASHAAMLQIAMNLRRSANVGIGYAFSANHIRDRITQA